MTAREPETYGLEPFVFDEWGDIDDCPPFPFPNMGGSRAKGWRLVDSLFCDSSGCGQPDEPALTVEQLQARLRAIYNRYAEKGRKVGFAIIDIGQFQVYVGVFLRLRSRQVA